jgi:hypothetical protein
MTPATSSCAVSRSNAWATPSTRPANSSKVVLFIACSIAVLMAELCALKSHLGRFHVAICLEATAQGGLQ